MSAAGWSGISYGDPHGKGLVSVGTRRKPHGPAGRSVGLWRHAPREVMGTGLFLLVSPRHGVRTLPLPHALPPVVRYLTRPKATRPANHGVGTS